jgi:flagellar FliL protein
MAEEEDGNTGLIIVAVLSVVLLGGGGVAAYMFMGGSSGGGGGGATQGVPDSGPLVTIDPFVINLADAGKPRYLRVGTSLEVGSKSTKKSLKKGNDLIRVKDSFINHLSSLTTDQLRSKEDKARLRKNLKKLASKALPGRNILDIYFTEFMIQ